MSRLGWLALLAPALVGAPAAAQRFGGFDEQPRRDAPPGRPYANPSAVIGAEIAFNQLARAKGQWTAFRDTAAKDAVMFVPRRVNARDWLKDKPNPPVSVTWQPHEVWMSCDGSYAVTRGAWQRPNSVGVFTTVWQRQPKDGGYRWVLDLGDALAKPLAPPEMIAGKVAECRARAGGPDRPSRHGRDPNDKPKRTLTPIDPVAAHSEDDTLRWRATLDDKGAGAFTVERWNGSAYEQAFRLDLSPQG